MRSILHIIKWGFLLLSAIAFLVLSSCLTFMDEDELKDTMFFKVVFKTPTENLQDVMRETAVVVHYHSELIVRNDFEMFADISTDEKDKVLVKLNDVMTPSSESILLALGGDAKLYSIAANDREGLYTLTHSNIDCVIKIVRFHISFSGEQCV